MNHWMSGCLLSKMGGFHLHLFVFSFVYQFHSLIEAQFCSSFANDKFRSSASFRNKFVVIVTWKECGFCSYLFCCTKIRWLSISSTTIWVTGSGIGSVASRARSKLTKSKCEWTRIWNIYNVNETTLTNFVTQGHSTCTQTDSGSLSLNTIYWIILNTKVWFV